jgi:hypothetical protein
VRINSCFKVTIAGTVHRRPQPLGTIHLPRTLYLEGNHVPTPTQVPRHLNPIRLSGRKSLVKQNVPSVRMSLASAGSQTLYLVYERQESAWRMLSRYTMKRAGHSSLVSVSWDAHRPI